MASAIYAASCSSINTRQKYIVALSTVANANPLRAIEVTFLTSQIPDDMISKMLETI